MSLADRLLADLDGLSDGEEDAQAPQASSSSSMLPPSNKRALLDDLEEDADGDLAMADGTSAAGFVPEGGVRPADELDAAEVEATDMAGFGDVSKVAKLMTGTKLPEVLAEIAHYEAAPSDMSSGAGPLEENPEYHLVVRANNLSVEVENEILLVHKFVRDHYAARFPELEQLILDPWTYIAAVRAIGNIGDLTKATLPASLPAATILSITLTATSSRGRPISEQEWQTTLAAIAVAEQLRQAREDIFRFVESRMSAVAPNISAIVGTNIAAKLLGLAGGLNAFSRAPSCNVMLYGALKKSLATTHLSAAGQQRHTGFIFQSSLVQGAAPEDRRKAQRAVSAKVALAARIDAGKSSRDGSYGRKLHDELAAKIAKMREPPPNKMVKALPVPQETARKKRGGRRARALKERYAQTELQKLQNRLEFGRPEAEADGGDESVGLGMIGSGKVRAQAVDQKSRARMSRANKLRTQMLGRSALSSDGASGTSTSLSFTPVQGIEIVTPSLSAAQKVQEANDRWFASGTFTHVKKDKSSIPGQIQK